MKLERYKGNPILKPNPRNWWEPKMVYNPGVVYLGGKIHLFYTTWGKDNIARIGYARVKEDGVTVEERSRKPVFQPKEWFESNATEDARFTELEGKIYIVYAVHQYPEDSTKLVVSSIEKEDFLNKKWNWGARNFLFPEYTNQNRNGALFSKKVNGRYAVLHRPTFYHIKDSIWISYSSNLRTWTDHELIAGPREGMWDDAKIGPGGPPIEIEPSRWLLVYHGVKKSDWSYRLGLMLLDLKKPEGQKVICRPDDPILEPKEPYELEGVTPKAVFSTGQAVIGDRLFLYYGAADKVIGVATGSLSELLKE